MVKMIRKPGGRFYKYVEGMKLALNWMIEDEDGKIYKTVEEFKAAQKIEPEPDVVVKTSRRTPKKRGK